MASEPPDRGLPRRLVPDRPAVEAELPVDPGVELSGVCEPAPSYSGLLDPPAEADELGRLAHYRVLRVLGQGGMGVVFQAEDTQLQRMVALKVILPELAAHPTARERFLREARAAAAVQNDHVVTIYQVGQDRGFPFLAMELLSGQNLDDRLRQGDSLPCLEVLRIGREMCEGLSTAHARGMIHRDIKPANVWLETPTGRVKLLDFGLARPAGSRSDLTQTGKVVGSPEYMSPEQAGDDDLDARSDLFSLGSVLFTACTGQKPFQKKSVMAMLWALANDTPRPVRDLNPAIPPALAGLIERLMKKDPRERPGSAIEVRDALAAIESETASADESGAMLSTEVIPPGVTATISKTVRPARRPTRRLVLAGVTAGVALLAGSAGLVGWLTSKPAPGDGSPSAAAPTGPPIRVGVLHSRTGTMAISEQPVIDAILLAIDEVNADGGLLGRPVEAMVADGESDEATFAREADRLIRDERVSAIFGCWTSASRKAVVPVVERHDHLLVYPVQYEGLEQSPCIVYLGPVPNQQILPALRWLVGFEGRRRWFLVGSDYVFPRTANAMIRDEAKVRGCEVVGEDYLLLGSTEVGGVVKRIAESKPDLIVNTINGDTNVSFFRALRRAGITPKGTATVSFSISEQELAALGPRDAEGDYVAGNYIQSLDTPQNREFLQRFARRYGSERAVSAAMQTAYAGVHLWAGAVRAAGRDDPRVVREALRGQSFDAPQGPVRIDPATRHMIQAARVGRIDVTGRVVEMYSSPRLIEPEPFPSSRKREEWDALLDGLRAQWGGQWSNPGR